MDFGLYKPGRFAYLVAEPFARELWDYLTTPEHLDAMIRAIAEGLPAIDPLLGEIETRFAEALGSDEYEGDDVAVLCNNMILQILDGLGYEHAACGLCPGGRYIKMSGVYRKVRESDR